MSAAIAIDVGGTSMKSGLVDAAGRVLSHTSTPTPGSVPALLEEVAALVARHEREALGLGLGGSLPVGLVVPGIVDDMAGIAVHSANLHWDDVHMRDLASARLGRPVTFGHDVRAGALGEMRLGGHARSMVYVAVGTGIAAVIVLDGVPLVSGGWAGEIGQQLVIDPDSTRRVALEQVASAGAIASRYAQASGREVAGSREVFEAATAGDSAAASVIDTALEYLAESLADLSCALGPLPIVIGGGLAKAGEPMVSVLRDKVAELLDVTPMPTITTATLGASSQIIGAALAALDAAGTHVPDAQEAS
jgi:glucokinase